MGALLVYPHKNLTMPPGGWARFRDALAWRQRHPRLQALEFDTRARTSSQQAICRLAQTKTALLRVRGKRRIERRQESSDIAIDPRAQLLVDKRKIVLAHCLGVARLLGNRSSFWHGKKIAAITTRIKRWSVAWRGLEWARIIAVTDAL